MTPGRLSSKGSLNYFNPLDPLSLLLTSVHSLENQLDYPRLHQTARTEARTWCVFIFNQTWLYGIRDTDIQLQVEHHLRVSRFRIKVSLHLNETWPVAHTGARQHWARRVRAHCGPCPGKQPPAQLPEGMWEGRIRKSIRDITVVYLRSVPSTEQSVLSSSKDTKGLWDLTLPLSQWRKSQRWNSLMTIPPSPGHGKYYY